MKRALCMVALAAAGVGCGADFAPPSSIDGVRVIAVSTDRPYAAPGATVKMELAAVDGSRARRRDGEIPRALDALWIPGCTNPPGDLFHQCYPRLTAALDAAFGGRATARLDGSEPLPAGLSRGASATVTIPQDALTSHAPPLPGAPPSARAFVFFAVCGGALVYERGARDVGVPLRCLDPVTGAPLGADDFVFGYVPIFVFDGLTNAIPAVQGLSFDRIPVATRACKATPDCEPGARCTRGGTCARVLPRCDAEKEADCPIHELEPQVGAEASEVDPVATATSSSLQREVVFAKLYATEGRFVRGTAVLYDVLGARAREPFGKYTTWRATPGEVRLFAVVYDNRGGVAWKSFDVVVE
ncbi:MAG: hypothetical protein JNL38_22235 [Myxococcales bacterium]|nr:hypothetical protein [Myxococcales bacterium]